MILSLPPQLVRALGVVWLTVVWVALWGTPTIGTTAAGALLGVVVVGAGARRDDRTTAGDGPDARPAPRPGLRPVAAIRLAAVFAGMLVTSTAEVARLVLRPRLELRSAVVTVTLPRASAAVVTLVANAVTLTPGTLTLDAEPRPDGSAVLVVHALHAPDAAVVRDAVLRLFALAAAACGQPEAPIRTERTTT